MNLTKTKELIDSYFDNITPEQLVVKVEYYQTNTGSVKWT